LEAHDYSWFLCFLTKLTQLKSDKNLLNNNVKLIIIMSNKKQKSQLFLCIAALCFSISIAAQDLPKFVKDDNSKIRAMTKQVDKNGWLYFKRNVKLTHKELFTDLKDAFGLSINDKMEMIKEQVEPELKSVHQRFQQHYMGIPIEDAEFFLHYSPQGELETASGKIIEGLTLFNKAKLSEDEALIKAMKHLDAKLYAWQDTSWENSRKREKLDTTATWKPKGQLIITFDEGYNLKKEKAKLAFKFDIISLNPYSSFRVYIDAQTGNIIRKVSATNECIPRIISATTLYNGQQSFAGCLTGWLSRFKTLKREDFNLNIITKRHAINDIRDGGVMKSFESLEEIYRPEDNWGISEQQFTSAHWALDKSWTYFRDIRGRNGWDGFGKQAPLRIDGSNTLVRINSNFFTTGAYLQFEKEIVIGRDVMTLDVTGHEFTHGMNDGTAQLGLSGAWQSRSLNESFADIFGAMVERHATGFTDFRIGEQIPVASGGAFFRDLVNPSMSSTPQPEFFQGNLWLFTSGNNPHQNGGVQNKWFTLLSLGGTTFNPNTGNVVTVSPIGVESASRIAWVNLSTRLGQASTFMDARNGSIDAARAIFGICSNEVLQCIRAWQAVGIDGPIPNSVPQISGPTWVCGDNFNNFPITISACWLPGATFSWTVPTNVGFMINGNDLVITHALAYGSFTITLTATLGNITQTQNFDLTIQDCSGGPLLRKPIINISNNNIKVYPNPTSDYVSIDLPIAEIDKVYNLKMVNTLGQIAISKSISLFDNKINMNQLSDGFYTISIQDETGIIRYSTKVLKQKQK
jgi:bacillolysin